MKNKLKYNHPALKWEEALPIGNGKFGAMVYGGYEGQRLSLNLDTFWSDSVISDSVDNRPEKIKKFRKLIDDGKLIEADVYAKEELLCNKDASIYLPVGEILIEKLGKSEPPQIKIDYCETELDMETATVNEKYRFEEHDRYENNLWQYRKTYISKPHDILVSEIKSDVSYDFVISFRNLLKKDVKSGNNRIEVLCTAPNQNTKTGIVFPLEYSENNVTFGLTAHVLTDGKTVCDDGKIFVYNAKEIVVLCAGETNFVKWNVLPDKTKDLLSVTKERIENALKDGLDAVYNQHVEYHGGLYNRVCIDLNGSDEECVDTLISNYKKGNKDNALVEKMFNMGRYLLITSSSPGSQAANLQGIWNDLISPPWRSDYTTNINLEMNYWPAEMCNLSECHEPLIDLVKDVSVAGEKTAKEYYGCQGFTCHHNIDLWRKTTPATGHPMWGLWPVCGGWLCEHLWWRYEYTQDEKFLRETAYPIMKKAARFFLDFLIEDENGYLVTSPSVSPENRYVIDGKFVAVTKLSAMDRSIIEELFRNIKKAADVLCDEDLIVDEVTKAYEKLRPYGIGSEGQLLEWDKEYEEQDKGHRHLSHLYGIYPSDVLRDNKTLYDAARKSLDTRVENGGGYTGWSAAWMLNLFSVFKDGQKAKFYVDKMLTNSIYSNLMDCHPPFQIDGNSGFTSGVAQMLMQSREKNGVYIIDVLPACPDEWKKGSVSGLRTVGGMEISLSWNDGKVLVTLECVVGNPGKPILLRYNGMEIKDTNSGLKKYKF